MTVLLLILSALSAQAQEKKTVENWCSIYPYDAKTAKIEWAARDEYGHLLMQMVPPAELPSNYHRLCGNLWQAKDGNYYFIPDRGGGGGLGIADVAMGTDFVEGRYFSVVNSKGERKTHMECNHGLRRIAFKEISEKEKASLEAQLQNSTVKPKVPLKDGGGRYKTPCDSIYDLPLTAEEKRLREPEKKEPAQPALAPPAE